MSGTCKHGALLTEGCDDCGPCGVCKFHWNMTVMPGDVHNRNCPHHDDEEKGCACQGCGQRYKVDVQVPDELWNRIRPEGKPEGAGLLCGRCVFSRIEALGQFNEFTLTGDAQKCLLCGHNEAVNGYCTALVPICSDDYHGTRFCGCKCKFIIPTR